MTDGAGDELAVSLSPDEAMTVVAALRQYEPFWATGEANVVELLATTRCQIESVIAKIRAAVTW